MRGTHYFAVTCLLLGWAYGQSGLELYGFGMPQPEGDAISSGIGGITVLTTDAKRHLFGSTASWYKARGTQLSAILGTQTVSIGDTEDSRRSGLYGINFLAHLNLRSAWGMFISPSTRIDMSSSNTDSIQYSPGDVLQYEATGRVMGGISKFGVGYSRKLSSNISLGVSAQFLLGSIARLDTLTFADPGTHSDIYPRLAAEQRTEFTGRTIAVNIAYAGIPITDGEVGLTIELPLGLKAYRIQKNPILPELTGVRIADIGYPLNVKIGYAHPLAPDQRLLFEYSLSNLPRGNQHDMLFGQYIQRQSTIRGGWSRFRREREESILGKFDYRVGFHFTKYYISASDNGNLSEKGLSAGLGYIFNRTGQRLDIAFAIGDRADFGLQLESEKFYRITVGFSTAELWFNRPKKQWD